LGLKSQQLSLSCLGNFDKKRLNSMKTYITFLFIISSIVAFAQTGNRNYRVEVLKKNVIQKEFVYGKWTEKGETETRLKYLGLLNAKNGKVYKIMNSVCLWVLSGRATNRIVVFNKKNQYLGNYYITMSNELPIEIKNGYLIFKNIDEDCDKRIETKINFNYGIPKSIFRKCSTELGDAYNFEE
jgi:hypothetical protein